MSKRKSRRSLSQTLFWLMSLIIVLSMVVSLIIVALPEPPTPTPTPLPTWTPRPLPSPTPLPSPSPSPTITATLPVVGPAEPTATETSTPVLEIAPPLQPSATPTLEPTATPAAAAITFAVCGDSRHNPNTYRRVLDAVAASASEFLIHTGDLVDEGTEEQWQVFRQTMDGFALPFYPVPGNHDGLNGALDGYLAYSGAPAAHYSFDRGPVHFSLADTHHGGVSAAELAWLREDLGQTSQPVKIVVVHHPPFDPDGTDHIMAYGNEAVMALMAEMGVAHVFVGHIHAYAQAERDSVVYTITGGGGAPLYASDHPLAVHHYVLVSVRDEQVTTEMIELPPPT